MSVIGIGTTPAARGLHRTSIIRSEELEWQMRGACRGKDTRLFFPKPPQVEQKSELAKAICLECPVMAICRDWALREGEPHGVWGGMSEGEREAYLTGVPQPRKRRYHRKVSLSIHGPDDDW